MSSSESDEEPIKVKQPRVRNKTTMSPEKWAIYQQKNKEYGQAWRQRKKEQNLVEKIKARELLKLYNDGKLIHIDGVIISFEINIKDI